VGVDGEVGEDIQRVEGEVTKEPVLVALDLDKKENKNRSRYIRLCYRRGFIYEV